VPQKKIIFTTIKVPKNQEKVSAQDTASHDGIRLDSLNKTPFLHTLKKSKLLSRSLQMSLLCPQQNEQNLKRQKTDKTIQEGVTTA